MSPNLVKNSLIPSSIIIASSVAGLWIFTKVWNTEKKAKPQKWAKVGTVKKLILYPIKSCQGIEMDSAVVTSLGLKSCDSNIRDRHFILVDGNGKYLTMVNFPKMAHVNIKIDNADLLTLSAPNAPTLTLQCPKANGTNERTCKIKQDTKIKALDCGEEVAKWFQNYLDNDYVRLCYHHLNKSQRTFEPYMLECPQFSQSDLGGFQNATSYLLIAEESIKELNTRLEKKSTWKNFRPNILIKDVSEPFAELNWSYVKIGNESNSVFNVAAPCHRCPLTTVDQEAGVLSSDGEPLKTLRTMNTLEQVVDDKLRHALKNKVLLGLKLGLHNKEEEGRIIHVGDPVYVALL